MHLESLLPTKGIRFLFFSGKGGVGKTSLSCAAAMWLAERGYKTLIVTTDPAPNLSDTFEQEIGHKITQVSGADNLWAMEINPDKATEDYRNRILDPARKLLPTHVLKVMEEQLSSPCATEVAAFDKFIDFMENDSFDVIIFDTAPTGHTLRLLKLPADWSRFIGNSSQEGGQTCIGPVRSLQAAREKYERAINTMRDKNRSSFVFILQPETTSIYEANRSLQELGTIGVEATMLIINGILPREQCTDEFFAKRRQMQERHLQEIGALNLPYLRMTLLDHEIKGVETLSGVGTMLFGDVA
jgi:arsenite-transporting ATPase